jgi:phosphoribosylformylglycinamidine synthase PurS subunit
MQIKVFVTLKEGVLDPQGKAIEYSLRTLGFGGVSGVRMGKYLEFEFDGSDPEEAKHQTRRMCDQLLANTVIEDYRFEIQD